MHWIKRLTILLCALSYHLAFAIDLADTRAITAPITQIEKQLNVIETKLHTNTLLSDVYLIYLKQRIELIEQKIEDNLASNTKKLKTLKKIIKTAQEGNQINKKPMIDFDKSSEHQVSQTIKELTNEAGKLIENILSLNLAKKRANSLQESIQKRYNEVNYGNIWRGNSPFYEIAAWQTAFAQSKGSLVRQPKHAITLVKKTTHLALINQSIIIILYLISSVITIRRSNTYVKKNPKKNFALYYFSHVLLIGVLPYYLIAPLLRELTLLAGFNTYIELKLLHASLSSLGFLVIVASILLPLRHFFYHYLQLELKIGALFLLASLLSLLLFINNAHFFDLIIRNSQFLANQIIALISLVLLGLIFFLTLHIKRHLKAGSHDEPVL